MASSAGDIRKQSLRNRRSLVVFAGSVLFVVTTVSATALPLETGSGDSPAESARWDITEPSNSAMDFTFAERTSLAAEHAPGAANYNFRDSNDIRLSGYQTKTFTSAPGSSVTVGLQNFALAGHSTLSLVGDEASIFMINVTKQFSLADSAKIVLSGGVQWNHVFFNVLGKGHAISIAGKSSLSGILAGSMRLVQLRGKAVVYGQVFAGKLVSRQAAQVITPPIVSQ